MTSHTGPTALRTTAELLEAASEFGHNLAVPGLGHSGLWGDCPQTLCRDVRDRLAAAPDPAPVREAADEDVARLFHEAYERLAPEFHYRTRESSAKPWTDVPEPNRRLMIATVHEVRAALAARPAPYDDDEFLDDDRLVIPSPEFVQRDPMRRPTARPGPSGDREHDINCGLPTDTNPEPEGCTCGADDEPESELPFRERWWREDSMVVEADGPDSDDNHFVGDAASGDDAQRIVDWHNAAMAALRAVAPSEGAGGLVTVTDIEDLHTGPES